MMNWRQILPLSVTITALLAGLGSILKSAGGEYIAASQFILLGMLLDGFDGNLARWIKGTSAMGAELDTFVDITCFGVAPAVLAYQAVLHHLGIWGLLLAGFMVVSGAYRLARFKVVDPYHGQHGYLGLPITVQAGWVSIFVFITQSGMLDGLFDDMKLSLASGPLAIFVWIAALVMLFLQVSHLHYNKPTKDITFYLVGVIFIASMLFLGSQLALSAALALAAYGFFYAFISPLFFRGANADGEEEDETAPVERF